VKSGKRSFWGDLFGKINVLNVCFTDYTKKLNCEAADGFLRVV
jgi:hypothetical protein